VVQRKPRIYFNDCFFLSSGLIVNHVEEPLLDILIKVFSINFLISSLSYTQITLFKKQLDFKKLFKVEVIGLLLSSTLAIFAAFSGGGVWSLIIFHIRKS
jgi:O-antigen/teichoic acid export membrane protein